MLVAANIFCVGGVVKAEADIISLLCPHCAQHVVHIGDSSQWPPGYCTVSPLPRANISLLSSLSLVAAEQLAGMML